MTNLASLNDVKAHLADDKLNPTEPDVELINLDVTRIIKGALSNTFTPTTLATWADPDSTPEYIRSIAGRLVASAYYAQSFSQESVQVPPYAQNLYDEAISMLNMVADGSVTLDEVTEEVDTGDHLSQNFWPDGTTEPKVSMDMRF